MDGRHSAGTGVRQGWQGRQGATPAVPSEEASPEIVWESDPPSAVEQEAEEVFKRAFWRRPSAEDRIIKAERHEWHDAEGNWFRSYGNENWEFADNGLMARRFACINDLPISEAERKFRWPLGRRPDDHPGLSELGL